MVVEHHPKYLQRLASVYIEKYDSHGADSAGEWFMSFLDKPLRQAVRPHIKELVMKKEKDKGNE